jgi:CRISPR/Cas system CSM-associated protein Csm4 (group 5 of RAMP superfamily)
MDKDYRNRYDKFKIATEILTNRYMLTSLLVNINNLCYYLEAREKTMRLLLPPEQRKKLHKTIQYKDSIEFDRFSISSRFFNALVHKYGAEVVSYSCVQLDSYLKKTAKEYSPDEIRKRIKEYAEMYTHKKKASDALADAINIAVSMDYKLIDTKEVAL